MATVRVLSNNNCLNLLYIQGVRVDQIMRTTKTSLTMIRSLSLNEYQALVVKSLEIFNGAENLGEGDVAMVRDEV
jgi:hypothetical protein